MRFQIIAAAILSYAAISCGPTERVRVQPYELKELRCLQQYRTGDIHAAKQALLDYIHILEQEEASGLPFTKTAEGKALATARLVIICRQLGDTNLAEHYLGETVRYARLDAQQEGDKAWLSKTDQEIQTSILKFVTGLDEENPRPKWRTE